MPLTGAVLAESLGRVTDMFLALDRDFRVTFVNVRAQEVLGRPPEELVGRVLWECFPTLAGTEVERGYRLAMETQRRVELAYESPLSHRFMAYVIYPSADGLSAFARDVTLERDHERERHRLERRYRLLFESSLDAVLVTGLDGRIEAANAAACEMFALNEAELRRLGRPGVFVEDDPAMHQMVETRRRSGQWRGELTALRGGRVRFPVEVSTRVFTDDEGQQGSALIIRDLTQRRRHEAAHELLAEVGRLLSVGFDEPSVVDAMPHLAVPRWADACLVDLLDDGQPVRAASARRGGDVPDLRHGLTDQDLGVFGVLAGGPPVLRTRRAPGSSDADGLPPALGSVIVVPLEARGHLLGALSLLRLADAQPFEPDDLGVAKALADRAALALDNVRLYAAQRAATRVRDEVLAIVSHDLRNPLNAISLDAQAFTRRLSRETGRDSEREILERISRSVVRAERLIRDLLDVSATEKGLLALTIAPQDVGALAREVVELARPNGDNRGLTLTAAVDPALPIAVVDRDRVQQVLDNLLSNAMKFTPAGGLIELGAERDGDHLHLWVKDTGPGIAPRDVPRLFERFWQASRGPFGLGLGLQIVESIVKAHRGTIDVDTALGQGTTFHVRLPLAVPASPAR